jgi:hypothetical protein
LLGLLADDLVRAEKASDSEARRPEPAYGTAAATRYRTDAECFEEAEPAAIAATTEARNREAAITATAAERPGFEFIEDVVEEVVAFVGKFGERPHIQAAIGDGAASPARVDAD